MRTREIIYKEADLLKREMESLVNELKELGAEKESKTTRLEKLGFYEPESKIMYYVLDECNEITHGISSKDDIDAQRLIVGNSFKTREDAEAAAKRSEIRADLLRNSKELGVGEDNYTVEYCISDNEFIVELVQGYVALDYNVIGAVYFTKEKAEEMIDKWGDDLKLLNI